MTVLAKYQRLESEGIWRFDENEQRRDIIVSIGKATITISAANGTALTHWSLPAIERLNPGAMPALYRPGPESSEELELSDDEMVKAVDRVLASLQRRQGSRPPLRRYGVPVLAAALIAAMVIWLPDAIIRYTASLVPESVRRDIGTVLLAEMDRVAGAPCASSAGQAALGKLSERLFPGGEVKLLVLPSSLAGTSRVPGRAFLVAHTLVEDFETPEVLAGYLLAEDARRETIDTLAWLLKGAGLRASLSLLTQGRLPEERLQRMAEWLIAQPTAPIADQTLLDKFSAAQVSARPYGLALDISGDSTATLIDANVATIPPLLSDGDWIALQTICDG